MVEIAVNTTLVPSSRPGITNGMSENTEDNADSRAETIPEADMPAGNVANPENARPPANPSVDSSGVDGNGETFESALARYGMELDETLTSSLKNYAIMMWKFNEQLNLTRHTTWDLFVGRDLRDCLQLAHLIQPDEEILDLGSGNGVPGIPLAIIRPDIEVSLAESVGKRAKVLDELVSELGLTVPVYASRGEHLLEDYRFSTIVSRAVGSLLKFCRWIEPHWSGCDRLLLVKGPKWVNERGEARHHGVLKGLDLRVLASYPLGNPMEVDDLTETEDAEAGPDEDSDVPPLGTPPPLGEGVILQLSRKGRFA